MAAKVSPRVEQLLEEAAALSTDELAALLEALQSLPARQDGLPGRHAVVAERVARAHAGDTALSIDEVEQSIRRDLDF